jgi:hypothetical protein
MFDDAMSGLSANPLLQKRGEYTLRTCGVEYGNGSGRRERVLQSLTRGAVLLLARMGDGAGIVDSIAKVRVKNAG